MALACRHLGLGTGHEVLAPAYNCGAEIDPLLHAGASIVFYRVDERAAIDPADILRRLTDRTRLLYVTHYFGWPQDIQKVAAICRQRGIPVLEDCALALFSCCPTGPLGTSGDMAIFNFPKHLPVPDGGALVIRDCGKPSEVSSRGPSWRPLFRRSLSLCKSHVMRQVDRAGVYSRVPTRRGLKGRGLSCEPEVHPDMPADYYFQEGSADWRMSRLTRALLGQFAPDQITATRRCNYLQLRSCLEGVASVQPLFDELPDGVCPLGFPVLVSHRQRWVEELISRGVAAIPWWAGYHRDLDWSSFPEARYLKDHVMVLPIHQDLDAEHIRYTGECVKGIAAALEDGGLHAGEGSREAWCLQQR